MTTHRNALGPDGKEGVDGSSPSGGFTKSEQMAFFVALKAYARRSYARRSIVPQTCPKIYPQIPDVVEFWLAQRRLTSSSTSVTGRCSVVGKEEANRRGTR